ncbi:MAG: hypothetical protein M1480_19320 [Bacteroidetes bacterium]|nr:hypothetical protein [Bacteroidota bacterium]
MLKRDEELAQISGRQGNKVDDFASKDKLDIIVSKWELNYSGADVEVVDVTEQFIIFN